MVLYADVPDSVQFHDCLYCSCRSVNRQNFPLRSYTKGIPLSLTLHELQSVISKQLSAPWAQQMGALFQQLAEKVCGSSSNNSTVTVAHLLWRVLHQSDLLDILLQGYQQGPHLQAVFGSAEMVQLLAHTPELSSALTDAVKGAQGNWERGWDLQVLLEAA